MATICGKGIAELKPILNSRDLQQIMPMYCKLKNCDGTLEKGRELNCCFIKKEPLRAEPIILEISRKIR